MPAGWPAMSRDHGWPLRFAVALSLVSLAGCGGHRHPPQRDVLASVPGVYHREGIVDAVNVQVDADGTYYGTLCGCDFGGTGRGRWEREGLTLVFLPEEPERDALFGLTDLLNVSELRATLHPGGFTIARPAEYGDIFQSQSWVPGRVCPECGRGSLGPTGLRQCDEPLPTECPKR